MVDPHSISGQRSEGVGPAGAKGASGAETRRSAGGPAFQVLLDKLQQQARELQRDSHEVRDPKELGGAVNRAQDSLEQALSLSEQLLEAYRESRLGGPPREGGSGE